MVREQFHKNSDKIIFISLVISILFLPVILNSWLQVNKKNLYCTADYGQLSGDICYHLFFDKKDIDVLFLGFSSLWNGVDALYLEEKLSSELNRDVVVRGVGVSHPGEDILRVLYKDLSLDRKISHVYTSQPNRSINNPHVFWGQISTFTDLRDLNKDLGYLGILRYYSILMIRSLRNIVSLSVSVDKKKSKMKPKNNGARLYKTYWKGHSGYDLDELVQKNENVFSNSKIGSHSRASSLVSMVDGKKITSFQLNSLAFLKEDITKQNSKMHFIHMPLFHERRMEKMNFKMSLDLFPNIKIIGTPNSLLWGNKSDFEIQQYFFNQNHLNYAGAKLFTKSLVPLIKEHL